jgi:hypothetical protein
MNLFDQSLIEWMKKPWVKWDDTEIFVDINKPIVCGHCGFEIKKLLVTKYANETVNIRSRCNPCGLIMRNVCNIKLYIDHPFLLEEIIQEHQENFYDYGKNPKQFSERYISNYTPELFEKRMKESLERRVK